MLRIHHVQLAAPPGCEAEARAFFADLLGLAEIPKAGETAASGGAWFQAGNLELHVGVEPGFRASRKAHVALAAADETSLSYVAARLTAAGRPVRWDDRIPGVKRFFTEDPWGNRLEILAGG